MKEPAVFLLEESLSLCPRPSAPRAAGSSLKPSPPSCPWCRLPSHPHESTFPSPHWVDLTFCQVPADALPASSEGRLKESQTGQLIWWEPSSWPACHCVRSPEHRGGSEGLGSLLGGTGGARQEERAGVYVPDCRPVRGGDWPFYTSQKTDAFSQMHIVSPWNSRIEVPTPGTLERDSTGRRCL